MPIGSPPDLASLFAALHPFRRLSITSHPAVIRSRRRPMSGNRNGRAGAPRRVASCMAVAIVAVVALLVTASLLLFLLSPPPAEETQPPPREPVELAIGLAGHERWLDALRAWAKLACFSLRPAEPRRHHPLRSPAAVATAAKKTLEMGKETVEHSAESAARATEEALERTAGKVKRKLSRSPAAPAPRTDGDL